MFLFFGNNKGSNKQKIIEKEVGKGMKFIRLTTITVLSTTILAGGAIPAFAEEVREVTTNGQIEFTPNSEEEVEVIPPVVDPEVDIDPEVPGTVGPLSIVKAVTMNFGSQVISNKDLTYNMVAEMANLKDGSGQVPYVSFAQVQDLRGSNVGWELQVSLSNFTSNTRNNVLTGAEIKFLNPSIQYEGDNAENAPVAHEAELKLIPEKGAVPVMTAADGKGAGASSVIWGDQTNLNTQFADDEIKVVENDGIQLSIPGSTAKDATTYTATLTWELTTTPGEDA